MSSRWRQLDLSGGGLQSANLRLAALLRKRGIAYALVALFPLGLHRDYLHDRRGAWLYRAGTLAGVALLVLEQPWLATALLAVGALFAIRDLARMEDDIARVNKRLRMEVYLSQTTGVPAGFRGRYTDEPQTDARPPAGGESASPQEMPSFEEQERRLRESAAARESRKPGAN
jgi:hypothetical protein